MKATPFTKILIANRGEIALRVMRTARRMGYGIVAVYSEVDRETQHVREADEAICIGGALPAQSYLNIEAIITAARQSGADAVHPGYGFLAESTAFAAACRDAGLVFIGPSPEAIIAMGHKAGAKDIMRKAGVPCVPGYQGSDQSDAIMLAEAIKIGFPVMIKAVAGGGGRGMRLAADAAAFPDLLRGSRSEAQNAFGDGTVILERGIENPRHIEIQVFGDRHGHAIHLGERDCSVQRRHQKLIEEAPSPAVSPELRAKMGAIAVAAIKAINYEGAGTLEFLLDGDGNFYFMEMNTRLQVEHPVTEAITGLDLVELQLRIAAGEPLPLAQEDVQFNGHAIEVRLCAEDATRDFMPQSGRMIEWQMPPGLRCEHALESGSEIPPFYDSMIAKLIAYGPDREAARMQLVRGLEKTVALGVSTNQRFLASCVRHDVFAAGDTTTAFIAACRDDLLADTANDTALAALLLYVTDRHAPRCQSGRSLAATFPVPLRIAFGDSIEEIEIVREREGDYVCTNARFTIDSLDTTTLRFRRDGLMQSVRFARHDNDLFFLHKGRTQHARDLTRAAPDSAAARPGDGKIRAAMNGRVVAILVKEGNTVAAGEPVLTLEAMKMEHVHVASVAGTVAAIHVTESEQVTTGKIVVEIAAVTPGA